MSNVGNNRGNWRNSEVVHRPNNGRNDYRRSNQNNRQGNQWFESRNKFQNDYRRFNDRGYQIRNRGQNDDFSRRDQRNRDSQINKVVKKVEIEKVELDLSKTKLEEKQKRQLQDLFNSFQGLFSDKPGLTHVLYHEIDTGNNPPVVSRPYRYDRLKQEIIDYHVAKMVKDGTINSIQSPYASPVVLCRKNNGIHHRIIRKHIDLLWITKYPRYPLPLIDDL
ncbi:retrovirus-related Pol polyprotein from transposon 17.6 [Trichonephila clavipes]|nr:retrovirus-related Pol polyprotein from transposon 17.6 [Trichonephila clavipes]